MTRNEDVGYFEGISDAILHMEPKVWVIIQKRVLFAVKNKMLHLKDEYPVVPGSSVMYTLNRRVREDQAWGL